MLCSVKENEQVAFCMVVTSDVCDAFPSQAVQNAVPVVRDGSTCKP